ncbi:hypothetical protein W04_1119 [Pseudoalteromonas sp. SW0106-04]|uniref:prepilin-type N-terminal cleavage/methylation domain-containing protein n=1 Tax=Pseudoalteromonas sp. SW0106-04 TaxID=1702169 RepID=UPI0006B5BCDA|nr:prepilin-type N-terminal cleavage/methylation domain-containing protein [Pseudoalteromonas sp. SW0106-04]GAP74603.1 hypothetical protein W04_1119 [Pseudoalteromonas sp. SW0106-04]
MVSNRQSGFTLIELMLASSLLMLVMFSGYYAYSLYTDKWSKRTDYFWGRTQKGLAFESITRVIESAYPYVVIDDKGRPSQYFSGDQDRVIFVSRSPIFTHKTAVVEFRIIDHNGKKALLYNESAFANDFLLRQSDLIEWQHQVLLVEELRNIKFRYFGWKSYKAVSQNISEKEMTDDELKNYIAPSYYSKHVMEQIRVLPKKLNISFQTGENDRTNLDIALPANAYFTLVDYLEKGLQ